MLDIFKWVIDKLSDRVISSTVLCVLALIVMLAFVLKTSSKNKKNRL